MCDDTLQLEAFRELDPALKDCLLLVTPSSPRWPREALFLVILRLTPETPFPESRVAGLILSWRVAGLRQIRV